MPFFPRLPSLRLGFRKREQSSTPCHLTTETLRDTISMYVESSFHHFHNALDTSIPSHYNGLSFRATGWWWWWWAQICLVARNKTQRIFWGAPYDLSIIAISGNRPNPVVRDPINPLLVSRTPVAPDCNLKYG